MQGFWMVFADLPLTLLLSTLLPVAAVLVVVCLGIWLIVHRRPGPIEDVLPPTIPTIEQKEHPTVESMV